MSRYYSVTIEYFHKDTIIEFYKKIKHVDFLSITPERQAELDELVKSYYDVLVTGNYPLMILMQKTIEKTYGFHKILTNADEYAYFYINIIDPNLRFLEIYKYYNTIEDIKEACKKEFRIYDKTLITLESRYNNKFKPYEPSELCARNRTKNISVQ